MLHETNCIVLDCETRASADDCRYCGHDVDTHRWGVNVSPSTPAPTTLICRHFEKIGWEDKVALGLSIGCYWDYQDGLCHWFDPHTLEATMRLCVAWQPLLGSFNGRQFDFPLMRGLLRRQADAMMQAQEAGEGQLDAEELIALCDAFKVLCATSYDLLAEIWKADPARKFERGLNSLEAIAQASGLGPKLSHGAQAPRDWRNGHIAKVLNYCQSDVYLTKTLFEMVCEDKSIIRGDGLPLLLPRPVFEEPSHE
jgi:hypothetical protein